MIARMVPVGILLALLTAASVAQNSPARTSAEGSTDNIRDIDLARMVLPLSGYGPDYASFELDAESLTFGAEDGDAVVMNGYAMSFNNPDQRSLSGPQRVTSSATLLTSDTDAADLIAELEASIQNGGGDEETEVTTFPVLGLNGALGIRTVIPLVPGSDLFLLQYTVVLFPRDRLLGQVAFIRYDDMSISADATTAANALNERMKGVLTGKITDFPAPLPPDVNCNGSVDSIDASLVLQLGAGLVDSLPCDALADASQDGTTNAIDASLILQYSAGLIDRLPVL